MTDTAAALPPGDVLALLGTRISGRPTSHIAGALSEMIGSGEIEPGTRLPTVRAVAKALGISPGSVSAAWAQLRERGLIATHRRGGTMVAGGRLPNASVSDVWTTMDLAYGLPDAALQPDLAPAFAAVLGRPRRRSSREGLSEALHAAVCADWPFAAEAFVPVGGHNEGTILAIEAAAPRDSCVAIEDPTSPRILNILGLLGLRPIAVHCDARGPKPESLEAALAQRPVAFIFQPRAQIPLGHSVDPARLADLADVLRRSGQQISVIEDDHMGPISLSPDVSLGAHYAGPLLHVRGYCKAFGVELRTCVIGGGRALIDQVQSLRAHGISATSQILQDALAWLISDARARQVIAAAGRRYEDRRLSLGRALGRYGIRTSGDDGMLLCLPVADETTAIVSLAKGGLIVGPGSKCFSGAPSDRHFVRIATSLLPDNSAQIASLAEIIARSLQSSEMQEPD